MNRKNRALFSALISLIIFTIIPLYASNKLPIELFDPMVNVEFDIESFMYQIAAIGVLSSIISLIKGFADETSFTYLFTALIGNGLSLYFIISTLTLGDITSLGVSSIRMNITGGSNILKLDMSVFIWFAVFTLGLQILLNIITFMDSRKNNSKSSSIEQIAIDVQMHEQQFTHNRVDE